MNRAAPLDPEELRVCWACGFQTHEPSAQCPKCGENLQSRRGSRRAGAILVVLGAFLAVGAWMLLSWLWPRLRHPGIEVGGSTFTGTPQEATMILALIGAVGLFGAVGFGYGLWQVRTGRRNRPVVMFLLGIVALLYVAGLWIRRGGG